MTGSSLIARIRNRPNDAPMPTERLLDEVADALEAYRAALTAIVTFNTYPRQTYLTAWEQGAWSLAEMKSIARKALDENDGEI